MRCPSLVKDQGQTAGVKSYFETVFPKMSSDYALDSVSLDERGYSFCSSSDKARR